MPRGPGGEGGHGGQTSPALMAPQEGFFLQWRREGRLPSCTEKEWGLPGGWGRGSATRQGTFLCHLGIRPRNLGTHVLYSLALQLRGTPGACLSLGITPCSRPPHEHRNTPPAPLPRAPAPPHPSGIWQIKEEGWQAAPPPLPPPSPCPPGTARIPATWKINSPASLITVMCQEPCSRSASRTPAQSIRSQFAFGWLARNRGAEAEGGHGTGDGEQRGALHHDAQPHGGLGASGPPP